MDNKIKVMIVEHKKKRIKKGIMPLERIIEESVPNFYEFIYTYGEKETLNEVQKLQPEIVYLGHQKHMDSLSLLEKIKEINEHIEVFVFLPTVENEQDVFDEYMLAGAYKCYLTPPLIIDSLIHDMYVALNVE